MNLDQFVTVPLPIQSGALARDVIFNVRVPPLRLQDEHGKRVDAAKAAKDREQFWSIVKQDIEIGVASWGESEPFTFDALQSKLDELEIVHLFRAWIVASDNQPE
ncbi:MAG TPA: hypothetical protein PK402_11295 [Tepidisphaeraceae bacterium]|nr:hypothetical protein [Tepidisphaeraceae bacterium]